MARSRNIKPGFFTSDQLSECDPLARLLFAGLWCLADREGRLQDRYRRIKIELLPYDECDVDALLTQLHDNGLIIRYEASGVRCIQIINFTKHQDPHYKEKPSEIPPMHGHTDSGATGGMVSERVRQDVFNRDGRKCVECESPDSLSLDHKIPRSKGGGHNEDNLQTLCRRCNSSKNNRQAKAVVDLSSVNDRSMIGQSSPGLASPDSLNLIPSSLIPSSLIPDSLIPDSFNPSKSKVKNTTRSASAFPRPETVPEQVWEDFLANRKKKKLANTATAWRGIMDQVAIAGIPIYDAMLICCERGWGSFRANWDWRDNPQADSRATSAVMRGVMALEKMKGGNIE